MSKTPPKRCPTRWSQTLGFFQVAFKLCPRGPRGDQQAPKASQERSKSGQERLQSTQERPKSRQEQPESDRNLPGGRPMCQQRYVFYAFLRFPMFCGVFLFFGAFASFFCVLDGFSMLGCSCFYKFASSCHATQDFGGSFQSWGREGVSTSQGLG